MSADGADFGCIDRGGNRGRLVLLTVSLRRLAALYAGVPVVNTGLHVPRKDLPKTVRESER